MAWNRFDICEAYYLFLSAWHAGQWSRDYARLSRLLGYFTPGPCFGRRSLTPNGRRILAGLIRRRRTARKETA